MPGEVTLQGGAIWPGWVVAVFFRTLAWALCLGLTACHGGDEAGDRPRHLVLFTVDTLRADHTTPYGYPRSTTDGSAGAESSGYSLERLAREGVLFERAFAPRGMTFPSVATLFTGRSPLEHCALANGTRLPAAADTLAEALRAQGFRTAAFTTNQLLVPGSGVEQGFEEFFTDRSLDRDLLAIRAATGWLAQSQGEEPLFAWVHLMGPHMPYAPPPVGPVAFEALFTRPDYAGRADGSREFLDAAYREGLALRPEEVEHVVALYDAEVARTDLLMGEFLAALDGAGGVLQPMLEETLFVFASDHGEELHQRERYWAHSKSVYDSVLHVPLVLRHPASLEAGRRVDAVVELADLAPTVLELFDLPRPSSMGGRSLLPELRGAAPASEERVAIGTWEDRIFSVRDARWRLVLNPEGVEPDDAPEGPYSIPRVALFDHARDPQEQTDVAAEHPAEVRRLARALEDWSRSLELCGSIERDESEAMLRKLIELGYVDDPEREERPR